MGALAAVARGSHEQSQLIVLRHERRCDRATASKPSRHRDGDGGGEVRAIRAL
jgi:hypothetical protein